MSGFGRKGEGKTANYGVAIPPPSLVPDADLPLALRQPGSASERHGGEGPPGEPLIPPPIPATSELVEEWISTNYQPLTNISTNNPPEVGESILWRGVKTGPRGQPSKKVEHFQGKVLGLELDMDDELYLFIQSQDKKEVRKVHVTYVEIPSEPWLRAAGGRCYREEELRTKFVSMVKCPACLFCERWFKSGLAYRQHYRQCHLSV